MKNSYQNFFLNARYGLSWMILLVFSAVSPPVSAVEMSLEDALNIALNETPRGGIIKGNLEVAQQQYNAKRINFYLPSISINGSLPSYSEDETYRFFGGATEKSLYKTRDLGLSSFIKLEQSLITGGDLEVTANLTKNDERYPLTSITGVFIDENNQQGYFNFSYKQPLLKPSDSKYELKNLQDDREIAFYTKMQEEGELKNEVTAAYMGILRSRLQLEIAADKVEQARLQVEIDSAKFADGVISEENFLESKATMLDAELENFEAETSTKEKNRELAQLLDIDPSKTIDPVEPTVFEHITEKRSQSMIANWEQSVAIKIAEHQYYKSKREAEYSAGSHGLVGDLTANYSFGRGTIEREVAGTSVGDDEINTNSWGVSLNFTYPIWDGGASGAAVKASRFKADQARLEFESKEKSAKAEIINLVNGLDVSYRRLGIIRKQVELAEIKLNIAESRLNDGQISRVEYLENKIFYLETRDKYLEELETYLTNRIDLESKFII
ncbi:MAG: TolC family protein [Candidatus Zixiibacteriota bacterium]